MAFSLSAKGQKNTTDSTEWVTVVAVNYEGNKKTKELVLNRELTFFVGDSIQKVDLDSKLNRSNENIFNTSLFNKVSHQVVWNNSSEIEVNFTLEERWYIWPYPILENADRNFNTWWQTKDFNRLNYGVNLTMNNFRGRNETLAILVKVGFEDQLSIGYTIPNLNKKKTLGLSVATGYAEYTEVNYTSENNKRVFYKSESGPARNIAFARAALTYRKSLNSRHQLKLNYTRDEISSRVLEVSTDFFKNNDTISEYFSLHYYGKYDTRDYMDYPLRGYKVEWFVNQFGLGAFDNHNLNMTTVIGGYNWHRPLADRWNFAAAVVAKTTFGDTPPYALQQGLGYTYYVRGYELYVMDAQSYGTLRSNLKYRLINRKDFTIQWLKAETFNKPYFTVYMNLFADVGYANDDLYALQNPLSNKWLMGYGLGLDVVAYYDFVMRLEYAFNTERQQGFYLHFKKSI